MTRDSGINRAAIRPRDPVAIRLSLSSQVDIRPSNQVAIHLSSLVASHPNSQPASRPSNRVIPRKVGIRLNRLPADIRLSSRAALGLRGPAVSRLAVPLHRARRAR
jgi:hypothetical protein